MNTYPSSHPDRVPFSEGANSDCPQVARPLPDCYCRSLTGSTIPLVIYFCRELFTDCPVYRREHGCLVQVELAPDKEERP